MNNIPSDLIAAVWEAPAETAVQELEPICTGLDLPTAVPSPNRPEVPAPQAYKNPIGPVDTEPKAANMVPISTPPDCRLVVPKAVPPLDTL